jgi:hypothetical protein
VDRGLPTCLGDGEVATDGGTVEFMGVGWAPATDDVLGELLQLEEGEDKVKDHPPREERRVGVSSPWKEIGRVGGPKCGEEWLWFSHWRGREAEGSGKVLAQCARRGEKKEWGSVVRWLAILTDVAAEKEKRGVWFGTRHTAGGAREGCGGPAQRSGGARCPGLA